MHGQGSNKAKQAAHQKNGRAKRWWKLTERKIEMRQKQKWSRIVNAAKIKNEKVIKERLSDVQMVANERA